MKDFLREYWIWIVAPIVFAVVVLVTLYFVFGSGDDTGAFVYNIF